MTTSADTPSRPGPRLAWSAQLYLLGMYVTTIAAFAALWERESPTTGEWEVGVLLAGCAAITHMLVVFTPANQSYHLTPGLVVAGAILLPPQLIALLVILQHVPEWLKERYPWFIQTFNIANFGLAALAASQVFSATRSLLDGVGEETGLGFLVAGLLAAITFVVLQHLLLAVILRFARGHSFAESGLFTLHSLSMDFGLALLGPVIALLWTTGPLLVLFALAPLVLLFRMLALPKLEAEARLDAKTELFNARHFSAALGEELDRARRSGLPLSLLVIDLDLLREINNRYGHLAGDAVLTGIARIFRANLRPGDIGARFGGEEFCIVLRETERTEAFAIAERIRWEVEAERFGVDTSVEPITATVSIGVASFPDDASDAHDLLHRADLAAYRAKAEGRNRVVSCGGDVRFTGRASEATRAVRPAETVLDAQDPAVPIARPPLGPAAAPAPPLAAAPPPAANHLAPTAVARRFAGLVFAAGLAAGLGGLFVESHQRVLALLLLAVLVAVGQALAVELEDQGTISVSAVGSLGAALLFGPRAALLLAVAVCAVDWSARRGPLHKVLFNVGALTLSGLAAASVGLWLPDERWLLLAGGAVAGVVYYAVNIGLLTTAISLETHESWRNVARERFTWLFLHYVVYGVVGGMIAIAYLTAGLIGILVFAVPVVLVRKAQLDYIEHTESSVRALREAATTIERQNTSLTDAYALLRDRTTETMESLAAAVDARDSYTAGHSRRVQEIAAAIGRQLDLDGESLESVSFAALFHDVGKLAVPESVLLKPGPLDDSEWEAVRRHPEEGERIIGHLGFLAHATTAIRHHHERFDGRGYPDGLAGYDIPLGARILHVADAFDSMVSSRVYRPALPLHEAFAELERGSGSQFCPDCVAALRRAIAAGALADIVESNLAA